MRNTSNQRSSLRDKMISSAFPLKCSAVPVPSSAETAGAVSVGKHALPILAAQHVLTTQVPIKDCEHLLFIVVRSSVLILPRPPFTIAAAQYSSPLVTFESLASELSSVGINYRRNPPQSKAELQHCQRTRTRRHGRCHLTSPSMQVCSSFDLNVLMPKNVMREYNSLPD